MEEFKRVNLEIVKDNFITMCKKTEETQELIRVLKQLCGASTKEVF